MWADVKRDKAESFEGGDLHDWHTDASVNGRPCHRAPTGGSNIEHVPTCDPFLNQVHEILLVQLFKKPERVAATDEERLSGFHSRHLARSNWPLFLKNLRLAVRHD